MKINVLTFLSMFGPALLTKQTPHLFGARVMLKSAQMVNTVSECGGVKFVRESFFFLTPKSLAKSKGSRASTYVSHVEASLEKREEQTQTMSTAFA